MANMHEEHAMNSEALREWGRHAIDYVANYWERMRDHGPLSEVKPGYAKDLIPTEPPERGEPWEAIFADLGKVVVDANTHWHHPHFFAYFPTANSYPAVMGDIISTGLASIGFTWNSSPSMTELEMAVVDWLAKALQLPQFFLNSSPGYGAGMIQTLFPTDRYAKFVLSNSQDRGDKIAREISKVLEGSREAKEPLYAGTASDCTLVALLCARKRGIDMQASQPLSSALMSLPYKAYSRLHDPHYFPGLVAYCSEQAHSSVEKGALLAGVRLRKLPTYKEDNYSLRGHVLRNAIVADVQKGLTPIFLCATIGTTNLCAIDRLRELGEVCREYRLWMHVDAAYVGAACICPEYRHWLDGIELVDSFNMNAHKALLVNFDCAPMWFRDVRQVEDAMLVNPMYLQHEHQGEIADFRNWQVPLGRRFRAIKLWFVMRHFGLEFMRRHVRNYFSLAKQFESLITADSRFELVHPTTFGLVCFRLVGENALSEHLMARINEDRRIHLVPSTVHDIYYLRLAICSTQTTADDVRFAYDVITELASRV